MAEPREKIAIFASGTGSNARKIADYFEGHSRIEVELILSNKEDAGVLKMATEKGIATSVFNRDEFYKSQSILTELQTRGISWLVLAGFLWLVPDYLIQAYPDRIVNIHPALLPKFGGKGMYGQYVHQAVKTAGEQQSGPTIHYVNEAYDDGATIFQAAVSIYPEDNAADIARKVLSLEHRYYPVVLESLILNQNLRPASPKTI